MSEESEHKKRIKPSKSFGEMPREDCQGCRGDHRVLTRTTGERPTICLHENYVDDEGCANDRYPRT